MEATKFENIEVKVTDLPRLEELLSPCPLCGGTTDINLLGNVFCHSCQQKWTITGQPIVAGHDIMELQSVWP